jgi:hypothetical protein
LGISVVAILNAHPKLIEGGQLLKTLKAKQRNTKPKQLWSPNFIGRLYQARTISSSNNIELDQDPQRAKPRAHWVRGHIRNQPYGPEHSQHKIIWIQPFRKGLPS